MEPRVFPSTTLGAGRHRGISIVDDIPAQVPPRAAGGMIVIALGLGVLREAASREFVDLRSVLTRLQETSFYVHPDLIASLLDEEARRRQRS